MGKRKRKNKAKQNANNNSSNHSGTNFSSQYFSLRNDGNRTRFRGKYIDLKKCLLLVATKK